MALTSILAPAGDTATFYFSRGNTGTLVDIVARAFAVLKLPQILSGGGETSHVF